MMVMSEILKTCEGDGMILRIFMNQLHSMLMEQDQSISNTVNYTI